MINFKVLANSSADLSELELRAIEEQLEREKDLIDKYGEMMKMCKDRILLGKYEQYRSAHRRHYETLYSYLKRGGEI